MKEEYIEAFDKILNRPFRQCVCTGCGSIQTHSLIYCKDCGLAYMYMPKTYLDALKAIKYRNAQHKPVSHDLNYVVAIYRRRLIKQFGINLDKEFREYLDNKLN